MEDRQGFRVSMWGTGLPGFLLRVTDSNLVICFQDWIISLLIKWVLMCAVHNRRSECRDAERHSLKEQWKLSKTSLSPVQIWKGPETGRNYVHWCIKEVGARSHLLFAALRMRCLDYFPWETGCVWFVVTSGQLHNLCCPVLGMCSLSESAQWD